MSLPKSKPSACLQCRSLKLRCERSGPAESSSCLRCISADKVCQTVAPARMGRPPRASSQWNTVWDSSMPYGNSDRVYQTNLPGLDDWTAPLDWSPSASLLPSFTSSSNDATPSSSTSSFVPDAISQTARPEDVTFNHNQSIVLSPMGLELPHSSTSRGLTLPPQQRPEIHTRDDPGRCLDSCFRLSARWDERDRRERRPSSRIATNLEAVADGGSHWTFGLNQQSSNRITPAPPSVSDDYVERSGASDVSSGNSNQALLSLLDSLCRGIDEVQRNQACPTAVVSTCSDQFVCILDEIRGPPAESGDEMIVQTIYHSLGSTITTNGGSVSSNMSVVLLVLSCYVKLIPLTCAMFAHVLDPPSPLAHQRGSQELPSSGCLGNWPCVYPRPYTGFQSKSVQLALLLQLVQ
ncbi:hypothetical protein F5Y18DRAFT_316900 [Xylariaceae sp. FL1019]|nr:hypothetical protein F5Y18DRAFT_316900 [Xylariaceae sp. FL1019]